MPDCDEGEDGEGVGDGGDGRCDFGWEEVVGGPAAAAAAAHGDVDVADEPAVEGAVPAAPEGEGGVVVGHTSDNVFGGVDVVGEGPEAEEAPGEQELQPDVVEVEVAEHGELEGGVEVPGPGGFGDGDGVEVVD